MTAIFKPTKEYLPPYYAVCKDMIQICDAVDNLYFERWFDEVCIKSQVYINFRNDMVSENADDVDTEYDRLFSIVYGIEDEWNQLNDVCGKDFGNEWIKRRTMLQLIISQLLSRPYTMENITESVEEINKLIFNNNGKLEVTMPDYYTVRCVESYKWESKSRAQFFPTLLKRMLPAYIVFESSIILM